MRVLSESPSQMGGFITELILSVVTKVARCSRLQTEADDLYYDTSTLEPDEM